MKKTMKTIRKIVSLLIVATLLTGCAYAFGAFSSIVFVTAFSADIVGSGSCGENVTYTLDSDGLLTISGTGNMKNYSPSSAPFARFDNVRNIFIEQGVTSVGKYAFKDCADAEAVIIPDSVALIDNYAFYGCAALRSVFIPKSVTHFGVGVFAYCTELETIEVSADNPVYRSTDNCVIEKARKLLSLGCNTSVIPDDGSVAAIESAAFEGCTELAEITIPDQVFWIGVCSFSGCSKLSGITIPAAVEFLEPDAFTYCSGL